MTRNGKIARLPREIRDLLNERIRDGEPGTKLVPWLNGISEVQEVLEAYFCERPITEQNLSEWKQGGYLDWLKHQESIEWMRTISEEAEELNQEAGLVPVSDRVSSMVGLLLGQMIRTQLKEGLPIKPKQRQDLLELVKEFSRYRKGDHRASALKMDLEDRREARERQHKQREAEEENRKENAAFNQFAKAMSREAVVRSWAEGMTLEQENQMREFIGMSASDGSWRKKVEEQRARAQPRPNQSDRIRSDPTESKSIQPDPTPVSAPAPIPAPQHMSAADPQKKVKIDGSPKDRQASSA